MGMRGLRFKKFAATSWDCFAVLIDVKVLLTLCKLVKKVDIALQSHLQA